MLIENFKRALIKNGIKTEDFETTNYIVTSKDAASFKNTKIYVVIHEFETNLGMYQKLTRSFFGFK